MSHEPDPLITTSTVSEITGLSPRLILRRVAAGTIPHYRLSPKVLRYRASEIEAWLASTRHRIEVEEEGSS